MKHKTMRVFYPLSALLLLLLLLLLGPSTAASIASVSEANALSATHRRAVSSQVGCNLCGDGRHMTNTSAIALMVFGETTCGSLQQDADNGRFDPNECLSFFDLINERCGCQDSTMPPTFAPTPTVGNSDIPTTNNANTERTIPVNTTVEHVVMWIGNVTTGFLPNLSFFQSITGRYIHESAMATLSLPASSTALSSRLVGVSSALVSVQNQSFYAESSELQVWFHVQLTLSAQSLNGTDEHAPSSSSASSSHDSDTITHTNELEQDSRYLVLQSFRFVKTERDSSRSNSTNDANQGFAFQDYNDLLRWVTYQTDLWQILPGAVVRNVSIKEIDTDNQDADDSGNDDDDDANKSTKKTALFHDNVPFVAVLAAIVTSTGTLVILYCHCYTRRRRHPKRKAVAKVEQETDLSSPESIVA